MLSRRIPNSSSDGTKLRNSLLQLFSFFTIYKFIYIFFLNVCNTYICVCIALSLGPWVC